MLSVTGSISAMVSGGMGYFRFVHSPDCLLMICQTQFDVGQATLLQEHTQALSARQAIAQSRKSRGLLDTILRRDPPAFKPTYNYHPDGSACRIFGTVTVKKVTGKGLYSMEITHCSPCPYQRTYTSQLSGTAIQATSMSTIAVSPMSVLADKEKLTSSIVMNLSHVITEFSFGPYFPDIVQPLDNSFELTHEGNCTTQQLPVATLILM